MSPFADHPDELISASVTGDLTDVERRQLEAHLAGCEHCRATLAAFRDQRQMLSGMAQPPVPRDLGARVRDGIEGGRFRAPWWRRPGTFLAGAASLATVAAAALLVLFVLNGTHGPDVGQASPTASPSPSGTSEPTPPASGSAAPTATPASLPLGMQPGDLLYTQLSGPFDGLKLTVNKAQDGSKVNLADPAGAQYSEAKRAALSPDGRLLAFATETGLKGTWRIFVTDLSDGATQQLTETLPVTFGHRLAWSPDGRYLAFTVAPVDGNGSSDVWLYDRTADHAAQLTQQGNAYFASWAPLGPGDTPQEQLWVSLGGTNPVSQLAQFSANGGIPADDPLAGEATTAASVFAPLVSPDGAHVLFWTGTMADAGDQGWIFETGGMPQQAAYESTASARGAPIPHWSGTPLFSDLSIQPGGAAFASGELTWAGDSDAYAFWDGQWTGTPEGNNYPDPNGVYFGRVLQGQLSQASARDLGSMKSSSGDDLFLVDVSLAPDGGSVAVTLGVPLAGDFSAPESYLRLVPTAPGGAALIDVGSGGADPPPWSGPGVFVPATVTP